MPQTIKKTIEVNKFNGDWYSFEGIPQDHRYIKIGSLRYSSDRKALNAAKKINPNFSYTIKQTQGG